MHGMVAAGEDNEMATDNAVSALGKLIEFHRCDRMDVYACPCPCSALLVRLPPHFSISSKDCSQCSTLAMSHVMSLCAQ